MRTIAEKAKVRREPLLVLEVEEGVVDAERSQLPLEVKVQPVVALQVAVQAPLESTK